MPANSSKCLSSSRQYPSVMSTIAQFVLDRGLCDINIRIAISNRETLQKRQRQVIESDFGSEVFDR